MKIFEVGEGALCVEFGPKIDVSLNRTAIHFARLLESQKSPQICEVVPAYSSLTIYFNPLKTNAVGLADDLKNLLSSRLERAEEPTQLHRVPVRYGGELGPDLENVANLNGITPDEVIQIHAAVCFRVFMLGFMPGFPYCGIVPEKIRAPRLASPRTRVPAGSVGIASAQTGIYPLESPGGWQLIGRTPLRLFDPQAEGEAMFRFHAGDSIQFYSISSEEFHEWSH